MEALPAANDVLKCTKGHALVSATKSWFSTSNCQACENTLRRGAVDIGWRYCKECNYDLCDACVIQRREELKAQAQQQFAQLLAAQREAELDAADREEFNIIPDPPPPDVFTAEVAMGSAESEAATYTQSAELNVECVRSPVVPSSGSSPAASVAACSDACMERRMPDLKRLGMEKAAEEALARKQLLQERLAQGAEELRREEEQLNEIRQRLNSVDVERIQREAHFQKIETAKREIASLEREAANKKLAAQRAEEAARRAVQDHLSSEERLTLKLVQVQQLQQQTVHFLFKLEHEGQDTGDDGGLVNSQSPMNPAPGASRTVSVASKS